MANCARNRKFTGAINPLIYSELSLTFSTIEALDQAINALGLAMIELRARPCSWPAKHLCVTADGVAPKNNVPAHFFIGAHAAVSRYPLLTRDTRRYSCYFADVKLIAPEIAA